MTAQDAWQPVGPVREHLAVLDAAGLSGRHVARLAGVSHGAVQRIATGRVQRGRAPVSRVRTATALAILAVRPGPHLPPPPPAGHPPGPQPGTVDATGTRRRIQALAAAGHPLGVIARSADLAQSEITRLLTAGRVTEAMAERIRRVYDDLWDARPGDHAVAWACERARARAAAAGWPPPAAWDDDEIDDPAAPVPSGWQRSSRETRSGAELMEDAEFIAATSGLDWGVPADRDVIAGRLGVTREALDRAYFRAAARERAAQARASESRAGEAAA